MKNDIGKVSFDELNHFVGVFHQMGRLPLESDFNEQNELVLRLLQRLAGDAMRTGSPNEGFRVDTHVLIDKLESRRGWTATPGNALLFVDYFEQRVGDGCLVALNATGIAKPLAAPLDFSQVREVLILAKAVPSAPFTFYVRDAGATHAFSMSNLASDAGWLLVRGVPGAWPAGFAADRVIEYGFSGLDAGSRYAFDVLKADLPLRSPLVRSDRVDRYAAQPAGAVLAGDDDQRLWNAPSLSATQATRVDYSLPEPVDASRARALLVSVRRAPAGAAFAVTLSDDATPAHSLTLSGASIASSGAWEVHRFALPPAGTFNWQAVTAVSYTALNAGAAYHLGPALLEADPLLDLVVMGGDGTPAGAGRFYGDGLAAVKEASGTYFTQADLPQADTAALAPVAAGRRRIDLAYLDLYERHVSYVEHPELREIALEGPDTCTRGRLVAQVRLLKGVDVAFGASAQAPHDVFAQLPALGRGVLSTKDKPAAVLDACADPCEPAIAGAYVGAENRLFRVEIHRAGDIGPAGGAASAWFKWSRDNAGVMCALLDDALAGATSARVEKPESFAVGDLVEIADDLVELITGPCEDRVDHADHQRGELRKLVTVNLQTRRLSWNDPSVVDPAEMPFHAPLPRALRTARHAKLSRWDGYAACAAGDVVLADGVVIEFGGAAFRAGDYWLFTTRTIDQSVERLIEAPPRGTRHAYYPLAAIHRRRADALTPEVVFAEDLRPRFAALPQLDASRVAYDPGACAAGRHIDGWSEVGSVQQAIDALCAADLTGDLRLHNQLLHGMGVICGLQLRCDTDRKKILVGKGYALDCDGDLLHNRGDRAVDLIDQAMANGLLDANGDGKVNLWIERAANGISVHLEPNIPQSFWQEVLEGTLLKDFFDKVVMGLVNFVKNELQPFPATTLPLPAQHETVLSLLNLLWLKINPSSGAYMFVSAAEHQRLEAFYLALRNFLAQEIKFCAAFDNLRAFPAYPYATPTGIDTMFGMLLMHRRLRVDPSGRYAYTCGSGTRIQVFDLPSRALVLVTEFPAGANFDVQDLAFNAAGSELYAIATPANSAQVDSVFATATLVAPLAPALAPGVTWGLATPVCDVRLVSLASHPAQAGKVFAIGRHPSNPAQRGLYAFAPHAVPLVLAPSANFNATGLLAIDSDGNTAVAAAQSNPAIQTGVFDRLASIDLASFAVATPFTAAGLDIEHDLALAGGNVYMTGINAGQGVLNRYRLAGSATLAQTVIGGGAWRLALIPGRDLLLLADVNGCRIRIFHTDTEFLEANRRLPAELMPLSLAASGDGNALYALNFGGTANVFDLPGIIAGAASFTLEPPGSLFTYRTQMWEAYSDLALVLLEYFKDGWCDLFLVDCPTCDQDDKVYLGSIEIRGDPVLGPRVYNINNFSKRHYAKSFRTWGYWLSALPLLPLVKRAFARFSALTLAP